MWEIPFSMTAQQALTTERSDRLTEKNETRTPPRKPDGIITTQRDGQIIVAELFFNHSGTETFRDKLLKMILADKQE